MTITPRRLNQSTTEYTSADDVDFDNDLAPVASSANAFKLAKITLLNLYRAIRNRISTRVHVNDEIDFTTDAAANTTALLALIADNGPDTTYYFKSGTYYLNPVLVDATGGVAFEGDGPFASKICFVPTGDNQVGLEFNRDGSSAGIGCRISNLGIFTQDTNYNKAGIKLVDVGETVLNNVNIYGFTSTGKDDVGLWIQGRESLWAEGLDIEANVHIRLGKNPDLASGYLSADHFTFKDLYLRESVGTTDALPQANVLIDDGVHISQLQFIGSQAWYKVKHGLYWAQSTNPYAYMTGLRLENIRTEGGADAAAYSVYVSVTSGFPLRNLSIANCEFDSTCHGVYTRNVDYVSAGDCNMYQAAGLIGFNIGTCKGLSGNSISTSASADAAFITVDSKLVPAYSIHGAGLAAPHTFEYQYRATAATYAERGLSGYNNHNSWSYKGQLADDATINLPCINANYWKTARIHVEAVVSGSPIEYGTFYSSPETGGTNGIIALSTNSSNTAVTNSDTDLCVWNDGSPGDNVYVKNRLGGTAWVSIKVEGARSVET